MARIVLGMNMPHSGMLGKPSDTWLEDGLRDRRNPALWYRTRTWTYPELEAERAGEGFSAFLTIEERRERQARCTAALDEMVRVYNEVKPDIVVIIGKDQKEIFVDLTPSLAIFSGEAIYNGPPQRDVYAPDHQVTYPAYPELAQHLFKALSADGFDLTDLINWPPNTWMKGEDPEHPVVPHGFGYIYHRIMDDRPPPTVPIVMNTFYPPTQPSMSRAIQFGQSLLKALKAWDSDKTVAVIASGGLSHFVCDETFDREIIGLLQSYDFDALAKVHDGYYQSGTSELKLYVPVMCVMADAGFDMTLVDYVPCYRTEAGTGEGMGFMYWAPPKS